MESAHNLLCLSEAAWPSQEQESRKPRDSRGVAQKALPSLEEGKPAGRVLGQLRASVSVSDASSAGRRPSLCVRELECPERASHLPHFVFSSHAGWVMCYLRNIGAIIMNHVNGFGSTTLTCGECMGGVPTQQTRRHVV